MGASPRRWPNWPMVKSSTESVIITPEPHRGKGRERVGGRHRGTKTKATPLCPVLFVPSIWGGRRILAQRKGIIVSVMMTDGKVEQDLKQITRVYCSCGSHSDVFADISISRVL